MSKTSLTREVDKAIAAENERLLADPQAIADAQAEGDLYRRRLEGDPTAQPIPYVPFPPCQTCGRTVCHHSA